VQISYGALYLIFSNILFASISGYWVGKIVSFVFAKSWVLENSSSQPLLKSFSSFCFIYLLGGIEMSLVINLLRNAITNDISIPPNK
jgi:putative flippase GtrA